MPTLTATSIFARFISVGFGTGQKQWHHGRMAVWLLGTVSGWRRAQIPSAVAGGEIVKFNAAYVLLAPPGGGVRVNGQRLVRGIRVLEHRDEVMDADGAVAYFSTEEPPEPVRYSGPAAKCGRCRASIALDSLAIKCACGVWYHHGDPSCFEYGDDPRCVACRRAARLDGSGLWSPEVEE
jgi:hypothetical protein